MHSELYSMHKPHCSATAMPCPQKTPDPRGRWAYSKCWEQTWCFSCSSCTSFGGELSSVLLQSVHGDKDLARCLHSPGSSCPTALHLLGLVCLQSIRESFLLIELVGAVRGSLCDVLGHSEAFSLVSSSSGTQQQQCPHPPIPNAGGCRVSLLPSHTRPSASPRHCPGQTMLFLLSISMNTFAPVISCLF